MTYLKIIFLFLALACFSPALFAENAGSADNASPANTYLSASSNSISPTNLSRTNRSATPFTDDENPDEPARGKQRWLIGAFVIALLALAVWSRFSRPHNAARRGCPRS